ncbi:hypothetical protein MLD38_016047 [Melastoma candidum]|uniref:Uncharacterized protein n=1 Tax=Melastoma candidum TaxID=119954 RepID=A0ACB9RJG7_9MYRT|nr:hypothetical protein MLD38_016047 [Melastoma candidum]
MMGSGPGENRPLDTGVGSKEGSLPLIVVSNNDLDWLGELLGQGVDCSLVSGDSSDVVVVGESCGPVESRKRKMGDSGSDDDCLVLDGDPEKLVSVPCNQGNGDESEVEDLVVVGETGQVACRDYPHSRHDCIKFPFNTTPHVEHCDLCHCYVCDSPAPCIYWGTGVSNSDHCHGTDKDGDWKVRRKEFKLGKSADQNALGKDCSVFSNMAPLADPNIHLRSIDSGANLTLQNPGSNQVMIYQSGQTTLPVNMQRRANLAPQSFIPAPAIHHPSSQTQQYGYDLPSISQSYATRQPVFPRGNQFLNDIFHGVRHRRSENPLYAPRTVSPGLNVPQPDGYNFRRNVRPRHVSSVANTTGIPYCPPASRAGYAVPNNLSWATTPVQFGGKFQIYTAVSADHNSFLRQNSHLRPHLGPVGSTQLNVPNLLPTLVPSGSSGSSHPGGGISVDLQAVDSVYPQIHDARAVDPSNCSGQQNQGDAFQHSALAVHHQPVQQSNHHLPQVSGLSSVAINDNWWSENPLYQGQLPAEQPPAAATVDVGMLFLDFDCSWDDLPEWCPSQ